MEARQRAASVVTEGARVLKLERKIPDSGFGTGKEQQARHPGLVAARPADPILSVQGFIADPGLAAERQPVRCVERLIEPPAVVARRARRKRGYERQASGHGRGGVLSYAFPCDRKAPQSLRLSAGCPS